MEPTMRERIGANRRAVLSSLWIFVLLNMLFRDIHEIFRPGAFEEYTSLTVSEATFLAAGVGLTLFISMIVLTRVLPYRLNRWANLLVPVVALGSMLTNAPRDLDDVWFLAVEAVGLLVIAWLAWTWRSGDMAGHDVRSVTLSST
jgi:hypothetical protein